MIQHHPGDDWLLPLAAGRASPGQALVLDVHLETCAECRARLQALTAIGGVLLEDAEPLPPAPDAWARTLGRIDAPVAPRAPLPSIRIGPAALPQAPRGVAWPRSLHRCTAPGSRWLGPGMRYARVTTPDDPQARLFLLRIAEGRSLPRHTHTGTEFTQVLCGSFDDGRAVFGPGDFDAADGDVHHQPIVGAGGECICLAYVEAPLRFDGRIASVIGRWIGM